jgi:hypothetical protein
MGPRNAYKDMLDNVVSPITCVSMNHQNQLEQMAKGAMFATTITIYLHPEQCRRRWWTVCVGVATNLVWRTLISSLTYPFPASKAESLNQLWSVIIGCVHP